MNGRFSVATGGSARVLLLSVMLVLVSTTVSATTIAEETETIRLGPTTEVSVRINYTDLTSEKVSLLVPEDHQPQDVRAFDSQGRLPCEYAELENEILCTPSPHNGSYEVLIEYETGLPATQTARHMLYSKVKRILVPIDTYRLRVVLPEGYGLIDGANTSAYAPATGRVGSGSSGRRIYVEWTADSTSIGDRLSYQVRYQELNVFQDILPASPTAVAALLLVLIAAGLALYIRRSRSEDTIASVFPVLKDDEKDVIRYMVEHDGECGQKDLVDELDYSKAKISRLVKDLEERNLVTKIKEGRRNRLKLKKDLGDMEFA